MARVLLLALTCAAAASAARYVDYSGVKMPAYGGGDYEAPRDGAAAPPSEDYHGHSPDAPASLDYKYEEEPRIKTEKPAKDSDEPEVWRKPGRKQRGLMRPMASGNVDVVNKYEREEDDAPKFRSSHRFPKHRSRLKSDELPREEESPPRRSVKYSRDRKDDVSDIDRKDYFHVDKDDFPDDKSKEFDEDVKFVNEATTRRVMRRKARDRHNKRKSSDLDAYEDEMDVDRRRKGESDKESAQRRTRPSERASVQRYRPMQLEDEDDDPTKVQPLNKQKQKTYEDYDDYYDMKRVYSIKSKLPSLLRRTTERVSPPTPTSLLEMLWTNRRLFPAETRTDDEEIMTMPTSPVSTTTTTTTKLTAKTKITTDTTTPTPTTTTTPSTTTLTYTVTTTASSTHANTSGLSLAEKSRLSIMKKDQRKEGQHIEPPTKKPPVLLQVTRQLPTVVMVEPPSSMEPWMRARELSEDSPERLDRVKKLMRHKLVAEAKSIHDLTDKWDELVCDYIDVSLLDSSGARALRPLRLVNAVLALLSCAFFIYWTYY